MRMELRQDHIDNGIKRSCNQCAVALAMAEALGKPMKVTSQFIHVSNSAWDVVTSDERIAKVGKKLRFYTYDFDKNPKAVKPVTLDFTDGVVEIVDDYTPVYDYPVKHLPENTYGVQGSCGCMVCAYGEDAFTEAERAKLDLI